MHEYERLEAYQVKKILKKLEETLRKRIGVSERGLGVEKTDVSRDVGVERYRASCQGRCRENGH